MPPPSAAEGIVVLGEARVGKTCFIDMLTKGRHFVSYTAVLTEDQRHRMSIDGETVDADFMDLSSTTIRTADPSFSSDVFMDILNHAAGVVLLYDVTSLDSFEQITNQAYMYVWMCKRYRGEVGSCEFVLVGTKADVLRNAPRKREVDRELAEDWAQSQGMKHFELSTHDRHHIEDAVYTLMRAIKRARTRSTREREEEIRQSKQKAPTSIRTKIATVLKKPPPTTPTPSHQPQTLKQPSLSNQT